jgi:hypothetical protein
MKYYHGSKNKIKIGEELISKENDGYTSSKDVEKLESLFEKYKPKDKISRKVAVYLADSIDDIDNLGGYEDYIYKVDPKGVIEKSDLSWYSEVGALMNDGDVDIKNITPEIMVMINNYWSGIPSDNYVFEYRCNSAKVISLLESIENDEIKEKPDNKINILKDQFDKNDFSLNKNITSNKKKLNNKKKAFNLK